MMTLVCQMHVLRKLRLTHPLGKLVPRTSSHFPWGNWCEYAFKHGLTLFGWYETAPGPNFHYKTSVGSEAWKELVSRVPSHWKNNPLRVEGQPELGIRRWVDGTSEITVHICHQAKMNNYRGSGCRPCQSPTCC